MEDYLEDCSACSGSGFYCGKKCGACDGTGKEFNISLYCNDKADEIQKLCNVTDREIRRQLYYLVYEIINDITEN